MYLRAFQIATGWARFRKAAFSNSAADNILIISPNKLIALNSRAVPPLLTPHLILSWWERWLLLACAIFAMQKTRNVQHEAHGQVTKAQKRDNYGIPDFSCGRIDDGAVRADHHGLFETARMVTDNLQ